MKSNFTMDGELVDVSPIHGKTSRKKTQEQSSAYMSLSDLFTRQSMVTFRFNTFILTTSSDTPEDTHSLSFDVI